MELEKKIQKAQSIRDSFIGVEHTRLMNLCFQIQKAQDALNREARDFFKDCMERCQGICCRNICINDVVTLLDLIYILSLDKAVAAQIHKCAQAETLFTADCLFLQDGAGPCIFAANIKPERCIITFCTDTQPIKREIKTVRSKFSKLMYYTMIRRPLLWISF